MERPVVIGAENRGFAVRGTSRDDESAMEALGGGRPNMIRSGRNNVNVVDDYVVAKPRTAAILPA